MLSTVCLLLQGRLPFLRLPACVGLQGPAARESGKMKLRSMTSLSTGLLRVDEWQKTVLLYLSIDTPNHPPVFVNGFRVNRNEYS